MCVYKFHQLIYFDGPGRYSSVTGLKGLESKKSLVRHSARPISLIGLLKVTAKGFIALSSLTIVSTLVMRESSQWFGKNITWTTGKEKSRKTWICALASAI